ncbi:MAG TPA: agmatine deiminase family protein, partial [Alphaproteobacteria bacterium]|nr:agmatine deiminase family protein [Alphaproteobacteria bacterium]
PYDQDADVARRIIENAGLPRFEAPFVLEGGAVHVDGEGTALVTEECLLNPNRNPGMTRERMEDHLRAYLGVEKVIWLGRGLEDDETDGHIDEVACFARPGAVLMMTTANKADGNYEIMQENLERLRAATDAKGRPIEVIELPQPARRDYPNGGRITLSYVNFYMPNGGIVMPAFDVAEDRAAFRILRETFPDRKVVQVPASDIVWGGGGIHCITQQQPAG